MVIDFGNELTTMRRDLMAARGFRAFNEDEMPAETADLPDLETGWTIVANSEIFFLPTGVTSGGFVDFESPTGRSWRLNLAVLDGHIEVESL